MKAPGRKGVKWSDAALVSGTEAHYEDAPYYDHIYKHRKSDIQFYVDVASNSVGPVLELGCGTGRVTSAIASRDVPIVGVDLMKPMLARARERIQRLPARKQKHVSLLEGDIRTLRLGRTFPLVISPFHVFMHFYRREEMENALETVRVHLAPKGLFVFDVLLPDLYLLTRNPEKFYRLRPVTHPTDGKKYSYAESFEYDPIDQIQWVHMKFEEAGRPETTFVTPLAHAQWFPRELESILHYNGFEVVERYGDFDRSPLQDGSISQIIVARLRSKGP